MTCYFFGTPLGEEMCTNSNITMASANDIHGACNCGAIMVYVARTAWPEACSLCHCLNCRASSGSLYVLVRCAAVHRPTDIKARFAVNIPVSKDAVKIVGDPKIYVDDGGSGKAVNRHFCGSCGS